MLELGHAPRPVSSIELSDPGTCPSAPEGERSGLASVISFKSENGSLWKKSGLQADLPWSALPSLRVSVILDRLLVVSKENRRLERFCLKEKESSYRVTLSRTLGEDISLLRLRVHKLSTPALIGIDLGEFFTFFAAWTTDHQLKSSWYF